MIINKNKCFEAKDKEVKMSPRKKEALKQIDKESNAVVAATVQSLDETTLWALGRALYDVKQSMRRLLSAEGEREVKNAIKDLVDSSDDLQAVKKVMKNQFADIW